MMMSVKEVASLLGVSEKKIYRLIAQNNIPFYKMNEEYQCNKVELLEWATTVGIKVSADTFKGRETNHAAGANLLEALKAGSILYKVDGKDKASVLQNVIKAIQLPTNCDPDFLFQILMAREKLGSTSIGQGIAIPHVRNPVVISGTQPVVALCFLEHPIDFDAVDKVPVHILFTLFSPNVRMHLHLLARLGYVLQDPVFIEAIKKQSSPEVIYTSLEAAETAGVQQHALSSVPT